MCASNFPRIGFLAAATILLATLGSGCANVRFNEMERLGDRTMIFDYDALARDLHAHVLTPREGSVGGFSSIGAGGCGCN